MKKLLKKLLAPMIREVIEEEIAKARIQDDVKRWMDTLSNIKSQGVAIACNIDEDTNMEAIHQDKKPQLSHHNGQQDIQCDLLQALQESKHYVDGLLSDEQSLHQHIYKCLFLRNTHQAVRFPYQASPQIQMILEFRRCDCKEPQNTLYKGQHYEGDCHSKF